MVTDKYLGIKMITVISVAVHRTDWLAFIHSFIYFHSVDPYKVK